THSFALRTCVVPAAIGEAMLRTSYRGSPSWTLVAVWISCLSVGCGTHAVMKWCCSMPIQLSATESLGGFSLSYLLKGVFSNFSSCEYQAEPTKLKLSGLVTKLC